MVRAHLSRTKLPSYRFTEDQVPWEKIPTDWYGKSSPISTAYRLVIDSAALFFEVRASAPPRLKPGVDQGMFIEGLWEYDVGELFLCEENSPRYFEINLGPQGAWWSCLFNSYRARANMSPAPPPNVSTTSHISDSAWNASILIPKSSLPFSIEKEASLRANVTFILESEDPLYLSATRLVSNEPDFHRSEQFEKPSCSALKL